jgi:hypothetical protein
VLEVLIANDANVAVKNKKGQSPLHLAVQHGSIANVLFLLERDAECSDTDQRLQNALHYAFDKKEVLEVEQVHLKRFPPKSWEEQMRLENINAKIEASVKIIDILVKRDTRSLDFENSKRLQPFNEKSMLKHFQDHEAVLRKFAHRPQISMGWFGGGFGFENQCSDGGGGGGSEHSSDNEAALVVDEQIFTQVLLQRSIDHVWRQEVRPQMKDELFRFCVFLFTFTAMACMHTGENVLSIDAVRQIEVDILHAPFESGAGDLTWKDIASSHDFFRFLEGPFASEVMSDDDPLEVQLVPWVLRRNRSPSSPPILVCDGESNITCSVEDAPVVAHEEGLRELFELDSPEVSCESSLLLQTDGFWFAPRGGDDTTAACNGGGNGINGGNAGGASPPCINSQRESFARAIHKLESCGWIDPRTATVKLKSSVQTVTSNRLLQLNLDVHFWGGHSCYVSRTLFVAKINNIWRPHPYLLPPGGGEGGEDGRTSLAIAAAWDIWLLLFLRLAVTAFSICYILSMVLSDCQARIVDMRVSLFYHLPDYIIFGLALFVSWQQFQACECGVCFCVCAQS